MARRRGLIFAAIVAAVVAFAAVVAWQVGDKRSGPVILRGDDPKIYTYDGDLRPLVALGQGITVEYDPSDRCLYALDGRGDQLIVVWPPETRPVANGDRRGVTVEGVGAILDGDVITGGEIVSGDVNDPESWDGVGQAIQKLGACRSDTQTFIVFTEIAGAEER